MHRRQCLATLASLFAMRAAQPKRPNILFLFADDQSFATLGSVNNPEVQTPNLDKLVRRGTLFTRAGIMGGTVGAVCAPSRAMLMTGQTLFHIDQSIVRPKPGARPFTMFPEQLKAEGYETFITGKWHNGEKLVNRAFSTGANIFFGAWPITWPLRWHPTTPRASTTSRNGWRAAKFSTELFSDSAIGFIQKANRDKPWLCYVAYTSPHDPRMAPAPYAEMYAPDKIKVPANFAPEHPFDNGEMKVRDEALAPWPRTEKIVREHRAAYYAMITHLMRRSAACWKLWSSPAKPGTQSSSSPPTMDSPSANTGYWQAEMYEPFDACAAGDRRSRPAARQAQQCLRLSFRSLLHACDLAGTKAASSVEGKSLAPILRGQQTKVRDSMFHAYRHFQRAVKDDRWKLILHNVNGKLTTQLFDLANDPLERVNKAEAEPAKVKALMTRLKQWMKETDDPASLDLPDWGVKS